MPGTAQSDQLQQQHSVGGQPNPLNKSPTVKQSPQPSQRAAVVVPKLPLHKLRSPAYIKEALASPTPTAGSLCSVDNAASASSATAAVRAPVVGQDAAPATPSSQSRSVRSVTQQPLQKQKQAHQPDAQQQLVQLPFDGSPAAPSLPQWRSALTTRWRPGGRFSQPTAITGNSCARGSQTSRV